MIILRHKIFSDSKKKHEKEIGVASLGTGAVILSTTKPGRLTGKVVRYHNTAIENVPSILEKGLKTEYSKDPKNLTNTVLKDIDKEKSNGLIYTSRKKKIARGTGLRRRQITKNIPFNKLDLLGLRKDKHNKTLRLEFDYDEIKGKEKIKNPELRGAKNWREYKEMRLKRHPELKKSDSKWKEAFDSLSKETHIFNKDIDPSHIVGGKGYKRRTLKQVGKYIKNNPGRFGKEAGKVIMGAGAATYGVSKITKKRKDKK